MRSYLRHGNAGRAIREAGYECGNPQAAWSMGSEMLNKPHVRAYLEEVRDKVAAEHAYAPERILQEVALIAFSNPARIIRTEEFWENDPKDAENPRTGNQKRDEGEPPTGVRAIVDLNDATEAELRAIQEISDSEHGLKVKFHSKIAALEMLGKFHKLWIDKVELSMDEDLIERLKRGRDRAREVSRLVDVTPEEQDDGRSDP